MDHRNPVERLGGRAGLADHLDVALRGEQVVHAPSDHFVIIEEKHPDMSVICHLQSLAQIDGRYPLSQRPLPGYRALVS
ncbi:hypothetical protein GCM10010195_27910 [Kitasatospora griseola]|nr:hypothetical protein GCM10010195_27910 [Kitasatospora griseola]